MTNTNKEPLEGVSVTVKSTQIGTTTNADGRFLLSVPSANVELVFSFVGMQTQQVSVKNQNFIKVIMETDIVGFEEVVAIGYGTAKKSDLTSAITKITAKDIKDRSKTNVMQSLAGKAAGIQILQTDGAAGFSPTVRVRGIASITAGTNPLYVIDGIPLENTDLNIINPSDVESIEILKDASSAAIYGSRGSNGVVIITTKSGKKGKTRVDFNYERGMSKVSRHIDMMDSQEYINFYIDARNNSWILAGGNISDPNSVRPSNFRIPPEFLENPAQFENTDWQDVVFRTGVTNNATLSVDGGNEKTSFSLSAGVFSEKGIIDNNNFNRFSLRSNINHEIIPKLSVGANVLLTKINEVPNVATGLGYHTVGKDGAVSAALQNVPIFPVYNENGNIGPYDPNSEWNRFVPYGLNFFHSYVLTRQMERKMKSFNSLSTVYLKWDFLDDFSFRTNFSAKIYNSQFDLYQYNLAGYGWNQNPPARGSYSDNYQYNWISENTISYKKHVGSHSINAFVGYSAQKNYANGNSITATDFPNDKVHTLNAAKTISKFSAEASQWALLSYIGRINYSYDSKYLLTTTLRRDGSSRFGSNTRWGYFPSASVAWKISQEDFYHSSKMNNLKLRLSYGVTGNNQIDNYGSIGLLNQTQYAWGENASSGLYIGSISNPDLKWEKTGQWDLGVDMGLFDSRVYIELDYYHSITRDMLLNVPVPSITGFTQQLTNIGKVKNQGVEVLISTKNINQSFKWNTDFNISLNRSKVLKLGNDGSPIYINNWGTTKTEIGQPIANFYGYIFDGVFMNQEEVNNYPHTSATTPGDPKIRDVNGDKIIDENDRTVIGNAQPDFIFGLTNTLSYKNFDFSITLQGQYGNEIMNSQTRFSKFYNGGRNQYAIVNNYWKSESDPGDGKIFKPMVNYNGLQTAFSTYWVEDGSFLRIRNVQIGYNIPSKLFSWSAFSSARLYLSAENLFVFTSYIGFDPENSVYSSGINIGNDYGASPMPRTITLGLRVNL
ncbi:MAG: TonB-dependent receptor [Chitinophagaceae bacterium]|nr:TonB-dependent receptor [Chitinophagaceae bacterium]